MSSSSVSAGAGSGRGTGRVGDGPPLSDFGSEPWPPDPSSSNWAVKRAEKLLSLSRLPGREAEIEAAPAEARSSLLLCFSAFRRSRIWGLCLARLAFVGEANSGAFLFEAFARADGDDGSRGRPLGSLELVSRLFWLSGRAVWDEVRRLLGAEVSILVAEMCGCKC